MCNKFLSFGDVVEDLAIDSLASVLLSLSCRAIGDRVVIVGDLLLRFVDL